MWAYLANLSIARMTGWLPDHRDRYPCAVVVSMPLYKSNSGVVYHIITVENNTSTDLHVFIMDRAATLLNERGSLFPVGVGIFPAQSFPETTRNDLACSKDNCLLLLFMIMSTALEYTEGLRTSSSQDGVER